MKKSDNIFVRAKAYVKEHPRTSFQDAIKKVAGKKVSGPGKVSGVKKTVKKVSVKKRPRAVGASVSSVRVGSSNSVKAINSLTRAKEIKRNIDKLEKERALLKDRELKDIYSLAINKEHKKLNAVKQSFK
jgi:hypothetical protein